MIQKAGKQNVSFTIVPTFFDKRLNASNETLKTLRTNYENEIWNGVIPVDTQFREASQAGVPLTIARPSCRGSRHYSELLDFMLSMGDTVNQAIHEGASR